MSDFNRDIEPPPALEERVVGTLRARGLLASPRRQRRLLVPAAAAAILIFAAGFAAGSWRARPAAPAHSDVPRFMLLLHDTDAIRARTTPEAEVVEEYRQWAVNVRTSGIGIRGEKLKDEDGRSVSGYFIVEAPSRAAAEAIADSCPHARRGGRIEVREIDPT